MQELEGQWTPTASPGSMWTRSPCLGQVPEVEAEEPRVPNKELHHLHTLALFFHVPNIFRELVALKISTSLNRLGSGIFMWVSARRENAQGSWKKSRRMQKDWKG